MTTIFLWALVIMYAPNTGRQSMFAIDGRISYLASQVEFLRKD